MARPHRALAVALRLAGAAARCHGGNADAHAGAVARVRGRRRDLAGGAQPAAVAGTAAVAAPAQPGRTGAAGHPGAGGRVAAPALRTRAGAPAPDRAGRRRLPAAERLDPAQRALLGRYRRGWRPAWHRPGPDQPDRGLERAGRAGLGARLAPRPARPVDGRRGADGRGPGQAGAGGPQPPGQPDRHRVFHRLWRAVHDRGLPRPGAAAYGRQRGERMSKASLYVLAMAAALVPVAAHAAAPEQDYAREWPLELAREDAGAYRVELDRAVYLGAYDRALRDVEVFNAQGQPVATAVLSPAQPLAQAPRTRALPWFPLPAQEGGGGGDIHLIAERDADGSIRRVEAGIGARASVGGPGRWLVDASRVREPVRALLLEWEDPAQPLQAGYRVEGSDDLRSWRTLNGSTTLLDLERGGERLRQGRIVLDGQARYLRLLPLRAGPGPVLAGVSA